MHSKGILEPGFRLRSIDSAIKQCSHIIDDLWLTGYHVILEDGPMQLSHTHVCMSQSVLQMMVAHADTSRLLLQHHQPACVVTSGNCSGIDSPHLSVHLAGFVGGRLGIWWFIKYVKICIVNWATLCKMYPKFECQCETASSLHVLKTHV